MTSKTLNRIYEKAKSEYLAEIQNDGYTCKGCGCIFTTITIHHIIKRSKLRYFYADSRNFIELCARCHYFAEGTIEDQKKLLCYYKMKNTRGFLLREYGGLELYEQTLDFKYGNLPNQK